MKLFLAILLGKLIYHLTRLLHTGGGAAAPGLYALKIYPRLVQRLAKQIPNSIVITGTNGKTTTSRMIAQILTSQGKTVIRNSTGSNLERGIASTLIANYQLLAPHFQAKYAVWEIDEAAFNKTAAHLNPKVIVFLNVLRDQLDRYGEIDTVVKKWQKSLKQISDKDVLIILNGDDHNLDQLRKIIPNKSITFGIKDKKISGEKGSRVDKFLQKSNLLEEVEENGLDGTYFNFQGEQFYLPLPGTYHLYDAAAALLASKKLGLSLRKAADTLKSYTPAFGRFEKFEQGFIFLIKNPSGATEVIKTITPQLKVGDRLLIALNDNFADGLDVSWIWDTEFERLKIGNRKLEIICCGTRAEELAVRLKYAGFTADSITIQPDIEKAFKEAKRGLKGSLYILPTYTALLKLQAILTKSGAKQHYWKEN